MPRWVLDLLTSWGAVRGGGPAKEVWRMVLLCIIWCIWHEMNARHFEDIKTSMFKLQKLLLNTIYIYREYTREPLMGRKKIHKFRKCAQVKTLKL
jgi:hypothetical protein